VGSLFASGQCKLEQPHLILNRSKRMISILPVSMREDTRYKLPAPICDSTVSYPSSNSRYDFEQFVVFAEATTPNAQCAEWASQSKKSFFAAWSPNSYRPSQLRKFDL
jgi:hypothetical protein